MNYQWLQVDFFSPGRCRAKFWKDLQDISLSGLFPPPVSRLPFLSPPMPPNDSVSSGPDSVNCWAGEIVQGIGIGNCWAGHSLQPATRPPAHLPTRRRPNALRLAIEIGWPPATGWGYSPVGPPTAAGGVIEKTAGEGLTQ